MYIFLLLLTSEMRCDSESQMSSKSQLSSWMHSIRFCNMKQLY
jgi:hypothetical protein